MRKLLKKNTKKQLKKSKQKRIYRAKHFCTPGSAQSIFISWTSSCVKTPSSAAEAYVKNCRAISYRCEAPENKLPKT